MLYPSDIVFTSNINNSKAFIYSCQGYNCAVAQSRAKYSVETIRTYTHLQRKSNEIHIKQDADDLGTFIRNVSR
jgi:hypothetical protein